MAAFLFFFKESENRSSLLGSSLSLTSFTAYREQFEIAAQEPSVQAQSFITLLIALLWGPFETPHNWNFPGGKDSKITDLSLA